MPAPLRYFVSRRDQSQNAKLLLPPFGFIGNVCSFNSYICLLSSPFGVAFASWVFDLDYFTRLDLLVESMKLSVSVSFASFYYEIYVRVDTYTLTFMGEAIRVYGMT